jgi:hypothetical protein
MREPGTTTTGHVEIDSNITRPRTQDDVVREILSNQPSDKHGTPSATLSDRVSEISVGWVMSLVRLGPNDGVARP